MINRQLGQESVVFYQGAEALQAVSAGMERALLRTPPVVSTFTRHLLQSQGKLLRTRALLASALDETNSIHENAVRVSIGIEILHLATLVHDDIIDNAPTRRGIPTLQYKYGKKPAVICGDYLLCMALKIFSEISQKDTYREFSFPDYVSRLCGGELLQHLNNRNADISVHSCLRIMRGKTAALFEGAFRAGAIFSAPSKGEIAAYAKLGRYVGMIFQLTDDCLDYESAEGMAKKPVQSDFEQGVITLPLVHTLREQPEIKERIADEAVSKEEILALVEAHGGVDYTKELSGKYYRKAERLIDELEMTPEKREQIVNILNQAYYGILGKGKAGDQKLS